MTLDPIERTSLALSAGGIAAAGLLTGPLFTWSFVAGAALGAFNFRALRTSAASAFRGEIEGGRMLWNAMFAVRFAFLAIAIGLMTRAGVDPTGLVIGLSMFVPAAFIEAWRTRPAIDPDAPALAADDDAWERWNPWLAREVEPVEPEEDDA